MARRESAHSVRQEMRRQECRLELSSQANLQSTAADWRPPLLVVTAQAKLLVTAADLPSLGLGRAGWRPPLLEPQD